MIMVWRKRPWIGRITGLAWTSVGGELLTIESATMRGKGELVFTGSLGDVMKESIRAAMSVVRANGERFGITYEKFKNTICISTCLKVATPKMAHQQVLPQLLPSSLP